MSYVFETNKLHAYLGEELVRRMRDYKAYVAGGTVTSLFCNREINDVDVYFKNEKDAIGFLANLMENGAWVVSHTKKATQLMYDEKNVQIIHFDYYENIDRLFESFDYTVCMGAFDFERNEYNLHKDFLKHNSQRIMKFNRLTSYPIVSMLRVQKYLDKGYTISKPEFVRVVLTCMTLKIKSYEELKDHLGGLYGENFDLLFEDVADEEFDLEKAIDKLADLSLSEDYFNTPSGNECEEYTVEELIKSISKEPVKYFKSKDSVFIINYFDQLEIVEEIPEYGLEIDSSKYFSENKFYKYVSKRDGRYFSHYNNSFEYELCSEVIADNSGRNNGKLYFHELNDLDNATYKDRSDSVLIEVMLNPNEVVSASDGIVESKKCYVVRELESPEERGTSRKTLRNGGGVIFNG